MCREQFSKPRFLTCVTLLCLTIMAPATADELIMRDGSRLLGEVIKRQDDGKLRFKTRYAGKLEVKWSEVVKIKTDKPMELLLRNNRTIKVTWITNNVDDLIVQGDEVVELRSLSQTDVVAINPEPWRKGEGRAFTGRVNFAFERQRGNTDEDEWDLDGDLTLRGKNDRMRAFGEYEKDINNNNTTKKKWKLEGSYNYFLSQKWFAGAFARLEEDKEADLNLRSIGGPLVGYQWFESPDLNLETSGSVGYVYEDFEIDQNNDYWALGWNILYDQMFFSSFVQAYHRQTGFLNLDSTNDVVWDTWTGLRFPMVLGLVVSTEIQLEYDSGSSDDADDWDTTYTLKLGYQW